MNASAGVTSLGGGEELRGESSPGRSCEHVVAVVVTYNSEGVLPGLLSSLAGGFAGVNWTLVVADNASGDRSISVVKDLIPEASVVTMGRNAGYAAGINAAVSIAREHTAVLILNPDVRLEPGCVPELLRAVREPGAGIAVPRLFNARGELSRSMRREPTLLRAWSDAIIGAERSGRFQRLGEIVTDPMRYEDERTTDWAEGSVQMISRECWSRCGPWDESFFLYSEETEFNLRARDIGYATRYVPTASAVHLEGDSAQTPGLWRLLVLNRLRLYRRRNGLLKSGAFWLALLVRESGRAVLRRKATGRAAVRGLVSPNRWREPAGPDAVRT